MLHRDRSIPVTYVELDVVAPGGEPTLRLPYVERHALLEELVLDSPPALLEVIGSFEDGPALWEVEEPGDDAVPGGARGGSAARTTSEGRLRRRA